MFRQGFSGSAVLVAGAIVALAAAGCGTPVRGGVPLGGATVAGTMRAKDAKLDASLVKALWERDSAAVKALLARGANPNAHDEFGYPVLLLAAGDGQVESVRALLAAKADVAVRDSDQRTALMDGAETGVAEIVQLLLQRGAEVNATDNLQWTALHGAALYGRVDAVKALLAAHADVTARTDRGKTPDQLADEMGFPEVGKLIRAALPKVPELPTPS